MRNQIMQKIPIGYKQTEIGVIPEDWNVKKLFNVASLKARIGWQGLTTAEYKDSGEYYLITGTDFKNGFIDWENCHYVEKGRYDQDKNIQIKEHDVLVTKDGTIGKIALINRISKPATLNSGVFVIRPFKNEFFPEYFYYLLLSKVFFDFLVQLSAGSTINHLYQKDFINFSFQVPSNITEQTAISKVLSDTDALIEHLEKLIAKKKYIKQGAMQQLITGKKRLPGFSGEWEYFSIENIAQKKDHSIVDGPFGSQMKVHEFVKFGVPVIEMEHLENKQFLGEVTRFITIKKFEEIKRSAISPEDIILSKTGTLGLLGLVPTSISRGIITSRLAKISVNQSKANVNFVFHWLRKLKLDGYWEKVSQGGTMQILGIRMIKEAPIPNISVEEQIAIATVLSDMDAEIEKLEQKLDKYQQIKIGMMQQLLTGKIRLGKNKYE